MLWYYCKRLNQVWRTWQKFLEVARGCRAEHDPVKTEDTGPASAELAELAADDEEEEHDDDDDDGDDGSYSSAMVSPPASKDVA